MKDVLWDYEVYFTVNNIWNNNTTEFRKTKGVVVAKSLVAATQRVFDIYNIPNDGWKVNDLQISERYDEDLFIEETESEEE
jgi:hypothetical protein